MICWKIIKAKYKSKLKCGPLMRIHLRPAHNLTQNQSSKCQYAFQNRTKNIIQCWETWRPFKSPVLTAVCSSRQRQRQQRHRSEFHAVVPANECHSKTALRGRTERTDARTLKVNVSRRFYTQCFSSFYLTSKLQIALKQQTNTGWQLWNDKKPDFKRSAKLRRAAPWVFRPDIWSSTPHIAPRKSSERRLIWPENWENFNQFYEL